MSEPDHPLVEAVASALHPQAFKEAKASSPTMRRYYRVICDKAREEARAALAAIEAAKYRVVPVHATDSMIHQGASYIDHHPSVYMSGPKPGSKLCAAGVWDTMLAAAPKITE